MAPPCPLTPASRLPRHPERDGDHIGAVGPRSAPQYLLLAFGRSLRVGVGGVTIEVAVVPVACPFPDAAVHRVQPVTIGRERPHRQDRELMEATEVAAVVIGWRVAPGVAGADQPATGRFLPLCLC